MPARRKGARMSALTVSDSRLLQAYKDLVTADLIKPKGASPTVWGTFQELYLLLRKWQVAIRRRLSRAAAPRQVCVWACGVGGGGRLRP